MEELLEIIQNNKTNFLRTQYGIMIKMALYDVVSSLLDYNNMVNERGDSYDFSDLLKYEKRLKTLIDDMIMQENTYEVLVEAAREKEEKIREFYESLDFRTIKDVETGESYRYVIL